MTSMTRGRGSRVRSARGTTLLEMVISIGISTVIIVLMTGFLILGMRAWAVGGTQGTVDRDASYAIRRIIRDVREAAQVQLITSDHAEVLFRQRDGVGNYIAGTLDAVYYVEYYRGTSTAAASPTGTYLWRAVSGVPESAVATNVTNLLFESDGTGSIRVTVTLQRSNSFGAFSCNHSSRVIKLRNW